jgi:RNA-directed DNA polymerase
LSTAIPYAPPSDNWVFGDKQTGQYLRKHSWFKIERHTLVKGTSSPDDPKLKQYWQERTKAKATDFVPSIQKVAEKQNHLCPLCGESLYNDEEIHLHHIEPRKTGGKDRYDNYLLLHLYCHQQVTANMR